MNASAGHPNVFANDYATIIVLIISAENLNLQILKQDVLYNLKTKTYKYTF